LWVVGRGEGAGAPDSLYHYDLSGRKLQTYSERDGIAALAVGAGWLWAAAREKAVLYRINPRTGEHLGWAGLGGRAVNLAYGRGQLWASVPDSDSLARVDPHSSRTVQTAVGHSPAEIAVAGGHVFVACTADHRVMVLNPVTLERSAPSVPITFNPYAMASGAGHVWVTDVAANTLTRIDY
jgi:streptogramin lyase